MSRPIHTITVELRHDWRKPYFGAAPYIDAMMMLEAITDDYGLDSAKSVVAYFLFNAASWRGVTARRIKAELKAMLGEK